MAQPLASYPLGTPFIELLSVDSTNNYALTQAHAGLAQHGMAIFSHAQTAGKGQRGRAWTAAKNSSILLSLLINPAPLKLSRQFGLSICVAQAVCEFFKKYAGDEVSIKWPNDLFWRDRKAGGILIENIIGQTDENNEKENRLPVSRWRWAIVGIGININQEDFPGELKNAVSLKQITGRYFEAMPLAKELCSHLDTNYTKLISGGFPNLYASYLSNLYMLNKKVRLKKGNRSFEAWVRSVTPDGQLVVEHGIEEKFGLGEIEWIIKSPEPGN